MAQDVENMPNLLNETYKRRNGPQPGEFTGITLHKRFKIGQLIGKGTFGQVYAAINIYTHHTCAVKIDTLSISQKACVLGTEIKVLHALRNMPNGTTHAPKLIAAGSSCDMNFLVMQRLGRNLSCLRRDMPDVRFTLSSTLRAGVEMARAIDAVHQAGFVHCDVKPANFAISRRDPRRVKIIDFGVSRRYVDLNGTPIPSRVTAGFRGTSRYASPNMHLHRELMPVDDYYSLLYSIAEMLTGRLPWEGVRQRDMVGAAKEAWAMSHVGLMALPRCCIQLHHYLDGVDRGPDDVNCDAIVRMLQQEMTSRGIPHQGPVDWELGATLDDYWIKAGGPGLTGAFHPLCTPPESPVSASVQIAGHMDPMDGDSIPTDPHITGRGLLARFSCGSVKVMSGVGSALLERVVL